ncbi:MAG: hypothetical protein WBM02_04390 [bacterium]
MAESRIKQLENGTAPLAVRMAIAEGLIPLEADELVKAFSILARDPYPEVRTALQDNLAHMPRGFLLSTVGKPDISNDLLFLIAVEMIQDDQIIQSVILNRSVDDRTLILVAEKGSPAVLEILAQNRNRMLENPLILKKLVENNQLSRVSRFALEEFKERFEIDYDYIDDTDLDAGDTESESDVVVENAALESALPEISEVTEELDLAERISAKAETDLSKEAAMAIDESIDFGLSMDDDESELITTIDTQEVAADEWDIENFVKSVKTDDLEKTEDTVGSFDDLLNITLEEEVEEMSEGQEWLGESFTDLGKRYGVELEDDLEEDEEEAKEEDIRDTRVRLMRMQAADKLILAQLGTKQERAILVTDPNKQIAIAVVEGPKMSEFEIQMVAANRQVYEEVLRAIAKHRKWGKSPIVRRELVLNPKTPLDISIRLLNSLNDFTLKDVMKSKEIPSALAGHAKRIVEMREKRRGA